MHALALALRFGAGSTVLLTNDGPVVLPSELWLVGLGHLGHAYAWSLCMLPFEQPGDVLIQLQDTDVVTPANVSCSRIPKFSINQRRE